MKNQGLGRLGELLELGSFEWKMFVYILVWTRALHKENSDARVHTGMDTSIFQLEMLVYGFANGNGHEDRV